MTQYKIIQFYQINITPIEDLNDNGNMYFTTKLLTLLEQSAQILVRRWRS